MDLGLKDKVVVVTGGASGIGAETVKAFLKEGAKVSVCGRNPQKLENFKNEMKADGYDILAEVADMASMDAVKKYAEKTAEVFGGIDIWVNNAGLEHYSTLEECEEENWNEVIDVDLTGVWRGSKVAIPFIEKRGGGSIINISSFCSQLPVARNGIYSVAKAGVNMLTRVLAAELAPKNIRVNCIIPGMIQTDMTAEHMGKIKDKLLAPISSHRFGKPEDIAGGILYLASDVMASYVNGHNLMISGGKFLVQNTQDPWNDYVGGY